MNCKDEINRKKSYYEGLEKAVVITVSDDFHEDWDELFNDESVSDTIKQALRFWADTVGPFGNALAFIVNNRFILEEKANIISDDDGSPTLMPEEIFTTLHRLNPYTVREFLAVMPIDTITNEQLLKSCQSGDKDTFTKLITDTQCDLTPLSRLCQSCWDDNQSGMEISRDNSDFLYLLDGLSDKPATDASERRFLQAVKQLYPSAELIDDIDDPNFDANLEQYFVDYRHFCENIFENNLRYYLEWHDDFQPKEHKLLAPFLEHPFAVELIQQIESENLANEIPFSLPPDFFNLKNKAADTREHFITKDQVRDSGVDVLTDFINYLTEHGYIRNDNRIKATMAYRLTGFCRPEGDLKPIFWCGQNGKSYELIFVVKHISERGDYRKMKKFFTGPEWVKGHDSSFALSANSEFRRALEGFYPKIFPFEKQASQR